MVDAKSRFKSRLVFSFFSAVVLSLALVFTSFLFFASREHSTERGTRTAFRRLRILHGDRAISPDQSLENTDSYPRSSLEHTKSSLECRPTGRSDISREACRIGSRDKMCDLSSRERKRERGGLKVRRRRAREDRTTGEGRNKRGNRSRWTQNLLGLSTDLIGFLVADWSRGKQQRVLILL